MRRRLDRRPARFPRVGERPAGTVKSDEGLVVVVFNFAAGDLGWRVRRGVEDGLTELIKGLV